MSTSDGMQQAPEDLKPQADTLLAALAVMERFQQRDFVAVDAIVDSTDPRELVMGLLDVSLILTDFLAAASQVSKESIVGKVREDVLGLVNSGRLGAGVSGI
ncbi:hypothetical protein [Arthrobacter caoxuetaonis]|uniref:Uncharacterized protein n=1 Tax=Arthrobacter caoxuetaonis TaxID=2886935 RepID=A0A9X1MID3_9MICC|nr:hypothetical protein [Arthrobacter caoxuetaonis]MCC3299482.1 hypothetical protein [Arthrobacter caoxuetaonis]USQ59026.1 hypothetical protein NF551_18140 [Arthrobacter caoxuetaonis]